MLFKKDSCPYAPLDKVLRYICSDIHTWNEFVYFSFQPDESPPPKKPTPPKNRRGSASGQQQRGQQNMVSPPPPQQHGQYQQQQQQQVVYNTNQNASHGNFNMRKYNLNDDKVDLLKFIITSMVEYSQVELHPN